MTKRTLWSSLSALTCTSVLKVCCWASLRYFFSMKSETFYKKTDKKQSNVLAEPCNSGERWTYRELEKRKKIIFLLNILKRER